VPSCCSPGSYGRVFSDRVARWDARKYALFGLDRTARRIVRFLAGTGMEEREVVDVGAGIGALGVELAAAGAARVVSVELSSGYEEVARALADERGVTGRIERVLADFAATPDAVPSADAVVLHRVVCCYPDVEALVGAAADRARTHVVLSYPRDTLPNRLGFAFGERVIRRREPAFRVYVRPSDVVLDPARRRGFEPVYEHEGLVWRLVALRREDV
jgi:2-polyprenyl-3-methyl-5-hydroxy-6-metoxy-1,4-benzoquinol methylase